MTIMERIRGKIHEVMSLETSRIMVGMVEIFERRDPISISVKLLRYLSMTF